MDCQMLFFDSLLLTENLPQMPLGLVLIEMLTR